MINIIMAFVIIFFIYMPTAAHSKSNDRDILAPLLIGKSKLTSSQERKLANYLEEGTKNYLKQLRGITPLSFKGREDINAETAAFLISEVNGVISSFEDIVKLLEKPEREPDDNSVIAWLIVARQISINIAEMNDLEYWGLVKSDWPTTLRVVLPGIFDRLIEPKIMGFVLYRYQQKEKKDYLD